MKTKLKLIFSAVLCFALIMPVCNAKSLDRFEVFEDESQRKLTVFGTPDGAKKGEGITIEILAKDIQSSSITGSLTKQDIKDKFILIKQVPADKDGGYTVTANMKGHPSGYYIVRVNGADNEIYVSTNADKQLVINDIKDAVQTGPVDTAKSKIEGIFDLDNERSTTVKTFNITDEVVFDVTSAGFADVFYGMTDDLTVDNFVERTNLSAYITALNEGKISVVDYKDEFDLGKKYLDAYDTYLTTSAKEKFTDTYYKGKNIKTASAVKNAFEKGVKNAWCAEFKNYADVGDFIDVFGEEIGLDTARLATLQNNTYKYNQLLEYLADLKKFSNTDAFASKANNKISDLLNSKPEGGGTGNSGNKKSSAPAAGAGVTTPVSPITSAEATVTFTDMEGYEWALEAVEALSAKNIINGVGEGEFAPGENVKREEILAMLLRAFEIEEEETDETFTDLIDGEWYVGTVKTAKKLGFVSGRPDGSFGIGDSVTREDVAVMAYNIAKAKGIEFDASNQEEFTDGNEISDYATEAVYALKNAGVINGVGEGKFAPKANCQRAEAAKIIFTLLTK